MDVSWDEFKAVAKEQMEVNGGYIYRGQADSTWDLTTTLHRTGQILSHYDFLVYFENVLPTIKGPVEAWVGSRHDLDNPHDLGEFLAFLQHNGFPTPLSDWTYSPYIAAYFAFEGIDHFKPQYEKVTIYIFNQAEWLGKYKQTLDYTVEEPHVSRLEPICRGNPKQMLQQGTFLFTNQWDIQKHIIDNEKEPGQFLEKYEISVKERPVIFKDLKAMNINAAMLAPSIESVCKKVWDDLCTYMQMGLTPSEFKDFLEKMSSRNPSGSDVGGVGGHPPSTE